MNVEEPELQSRCSVPAAVDQRPRDNGECKMQGKTFTPPSQKAKIEIKSSNWMQGKHLPG